jgi:hypothetical protein
MEYILDEHKLDSCLFCDICGIFSRRSRLNRLIRGIFSRRSRIGRCIGRFGGHFGGFGLDNSRRVHPALGCRLFHGCGRRRCFG